MWRFVTGLVLIIVGFSALGIELYALIIFDRYLILNPTLTIIRLAIWVTLILFGFRMRKRQSPQDDKD